MAERTPEAFVEAWERASRTGMTIRNTPELKPLLAEAKKLGDAERAELLVAVFDEIGRLPEHAAPNMRVHLYFLEFRRLAKHAVSISELAAELLKLSPTLAEDQLVRVLQSCTRLKIAWHRDLRHVPAIVDYLEDLPEIRQAVTRELKQFVKNLSNSRNTTEAKLVGRIEVMLGRKADVPIFPGEAWSDAAIADVEAMDEAKKEAWNRFLIHCLDAKSARPSGKWSESAAAFLQRLGADQVRSRLLAWLPLVDRPRTVPLRGRGVYPQELSDRLIIEPHADALRGLCWTASMIQDAELARTLRDLAVSCYRKLPGIGPRGVKVGNAAVYALGAMPGRDSLAQLAILRVKVKFGTAQKMLDAALDTAAARESLPRDEVEELAVPGYGLTEVGRLREELGGCVVELSVSGGLEGSTVSMSWTNAQGKPVKSVPTAVKSGHADELKDLKTIAKDIQKMLPAQRDRIDGLFLSRKSWPMSVWRERYLDHPLVGTVARRLIWVFTDGGREAAGAWLADDPKGCPYGPGRLVGCTGEPLELDEGAASVSLWHPIHPDSEPGAVETRPDVGAWRSFYEEPGVRQPFKQAHREVYLLTDAERTTEVYSNRFAAHILRQHQFSALCAQRGWKNPLRLLVDQEFDPATRLMPAWGLRAEYWVDGVGHEYEPEYVLDSGAFRYLATDQVRFYRLGDAANAANATTGGYGVRNINTAPAEPIRLEEVPPLVLSEVLRDVDMFVGVTSVGNDPAWQDGGPEGRYLGYWENYAFGDLSETAKTRKAMLERLVPRLSIASVCEITERFLVVRGKFRDYKIHLGSGNILMEPNDQYLCIVPSRGAAKVSGDESLILPFEGDGTLSVVLSKAFMLAEDDKITDRSILSQIGVKQRV